jgi:hypothetical protein
MKTLHLFGDSYTQGHLLDIHFPRYPEWREFRGGNLPLCWGDLLSKKLNMKMENHAIAGMSNTEIFQTICRYSNEFEKDDIVIINWTYPQRFRWAYCDEKQDFCGWKRLSANPEDGTYISELTRMDIAVNKTLPPYIDEVYEQEKLLLEFSKSKGFQVFFWSSDIDIINNLSSEKLNKVHYILHEEIEKLPLEIPFSDYNHCFVRMGMKRTIFDVFFNYGATTIFDETNKVVGDGHLGENGHFIQYELFYKYITKNNLI